MPMKPKITCFFLGARFARILTATGLAIVIFSTLALTSTARAALPAYRMSNASALGAADGKDIFDSQCIGCHSIGGGKRVGPDLKDVTLRRDAEWIKNFISNPGKMFKSDPIAQQLLKEFNDVRMPYLALKPDQVDAVVEYLRNPGAFPANPALISPPGDGKVGQSLFRGDVMLTNAGPSCIACHTVSGAASLGGGALGPDLTHVVQRLGETGLQAALNAIAFPTMQGPFEGHPLTANEQADLVAYLKSADQSQAAIAAIQPGSITAQLLLIYGIGLAGVLILFGLLLLIWIRLKKHYVPNLPVRKA